MRENLGLVQSEMTTPATLSLLDELRGLPVETEWLEFKEAKADYHFDKLGQYFSALANEANLAGRPNGWLVFGVANKPPRQIVGTTYRYSPESLQSLKQEISRNLSPTLSFAAIDEIQHPDGRVLLFSIPAAPRGVPVAWNEHFYGRNGESLSGLSLVEIERIRAQSGNVDWSAETVPMATWADLDPQALTLARVKFAEKYLDLAAEVMDWDDARFLSKLKLCVSDRLTRAALLLLGTPEAAAWLRPALTMITWVLKDERGDDLDYAHFEPPFLCSSEALLGKVRNLTYRYMPSGTLFPTEVPQYDHWVIREALHNCIAHQDYTLGGRINVVEVPDRLLFSNLGDFLPGTVETVIVNDTPPETYRNAVLARAMFDLKMIDIRGGGIRRMFREQRNRYFPLPDYTIEPEKRRVEVRIFGKLLDEKYTHALIARPELTLQEVMLLDRVQKRKPLTAAEIKLLRAKRLIEGRAPNLQLSATVADMAGQQAAYIRNRGMDKTHYKQLIVDLIRTFGPATRQRINELLLPKLPDVLSEPQKLNKISNLLAEMAHRDQTIHNEGSDTRPRWSLINP
jgi:ATP-dependent DNA helicase RecG